MVFLYEDYTRYCLPSSASGETAFSACSPPSDAERALFSLPARLGGLALNNPASDAESALAASSLICKPLTVSILEQASHYSYEVLSDQINAKSEVSSRRRNDAKVRAGEVRESLPGALQKSLDLAAEKGASSWLTSLPIEEHGFTLHKGAFRDALALRYGWSPSHIPSHCSCGTSFTIEHSLSCPKGGFPILRHNEIRDLTAV